MTSGFSRTVATLSENGGGQGDGRPGVEGAGSGSPLKAREF